MKKLKIGVLGVSNHFLKRVLLPLKETHYCSVYGIASHNGDNSIEAAIQSQIILADELLNLNRPTNME